MLLVLCAESPRAQVGAARVHIESRTSQLPGAEPQSRPVRIDNSLPKPISGLVIGYAWYPNQREVKAILGIPGAAYVDPVDLGGAFGALAVSSPKKYALGVTQRSGDVLVVELPAPNRPAVRVEVGFVGAGVDQIVLSPSGLAAALYYRSSGSIEIIKGLPHNPQSAGERLRLELPPVLTALALSDDGESVLAAVSRGNGNHVYAIERGVPPRFLASTGRVSSLSFVPNGKSALLTDYAADRVVWIQDVAGPSTVTRLVGRENGLLRPSAAAVSRAGDRFFVASSGNNQILVLNRSAEVLDVIPSIRAPTMLRRLGEDTFQFSTSDAGTIGIFRAMRSNHEVFFAASSGDAGAGFSDRDFPPLRSRSSQGRGL